MARAWVIDSRGLAKKVKNAYLPAAYQIKDCGANLQCPNCQHLIDNSDVSQDWPGLPKGVKFEPSDVELLEHLAAKCGVGDLEPHKFIDEFIPTLDCVEGICCAHPENLPGAKKDGNSFHFFYRIAKAYASGQRKRRRIQDEESEGKSQVRWHKTGKTKPVIKNGVQKGYKKIMVLYGMSNKGSKPDRRNWIMHQYHLGIDEEEKEGEYVVSKIFYQQEKAIDGAGTSSLVIEESNLGTFQVVPRTPKTNTPDPHNVEKTPMSDYDVSEDRFLQQLVQEPENLEEPPHPSSVIKLEDEMKYATGLTEDSNAVDLNALDSLLCPEISCGYDAFSASSTQVVGSIYDARERDTSTSYGISELENIELDTPPDFLLPDLQFASQDSVFDYFDRM